MGYPLEEWAEAIYPQPIHAAAVDYYYYFTNTTEIRRIVGGMQLDKAKMTINFEYNNSRFLYKKNSGRYPSQNKRNSKPNN